MFSTAEGIVLVVVSLTKAQKRLPCIKELALKNLVFIPCISRINRVAYWIKHMLILLVDRVSLSVLKFLLSFIAPVTKLKIFALVANPTSFRYH
nr:hypothetical protein Iba_scaffold14897CG0110 [Ipomoea batatas]GME13973.1 hypothetical protein Iba_scaffold14897CG0120 [Ipomoea batatas]